MENTQLDKPKLSYHILLFRCLALNCLSSKLKRNNEEENVKMMMERVGTAIIYYVVSGEVVDSMNYLHMTLDIDVSKAI